MSMTDEQVVRVLAEREGWKYSSIPADGGCYGWVSPRGGFPQEVTALPNYLNSRDALAPVLEKLTEGEKERLHSLVYLEYLKLNPDKLASVFWGALVTHFLLTIPPSTLARAIAEAIEGVAGATTANEKGSK